MPRMPALVIALACGLYCCGTTRAADLTPGQDAPAFSLVGSDGKTYTLADYKGKQPVVLAWFVKAFTAG